MKSIGVNITKELNESDFEIFANLLVSSLDENTIFNFSEGKDGGVDGKRIAFSNLTDWRENQSIQAKHTNILEKSCSDKDFFGNKSSIINDEISKINKRNKSNKLGSYVLVTNRKLSAGKHEEIRNYISKNTKIEINRIELIGIESIIELLQDQTISQKIFKRFPIITKTIVFIDINKLNKDKFLTNIDKEQYYQERSVRKESDTNSFFFDDTEPLYLSDAQKTEEKIILLGNPGIGKSTELKQIALDLWEIKAETRLVPVFKNLRTFTISNKIEDYIPYECNNLFKICLVFDGIDEISNKQDFLSKLSNYLTNHNEKEIKVILSIRSNLFDEYKSNFNEYKVYYLKPLSFNASVKLFENKFGITDIKEKIDYKHKDLISNPFMLNLYANYYLSTNKTPNNTGVLWSNYIDDIYTKDKVKYAKNINYNQQNIKSYTTKIAVVNELTGSNEIPQIYVEQICKNDTDTFLELNPFLEKNLSSNRYYFEHRNIQEYIFAQYLSEQSIETIIEKISIKVDMLSWEEKITNILSLKCKENRKFKFNQNLRNSISYLFLTLSGSKLNQYIEWCKKNQPEILFLSEPNLLEERTKTELFISYFKEVCINQQLWISNNRAIDERVLADFANNEDGYNFLLNQFTNNSHIKRVRISALSVLCNLDYAKEQKKEILIKCFSLSLSKEHDNYLIREIINCCTDLQLFLDETFLDETICKFKDLDNADINHDLLKAINKYSKVDRYIDFVEDEFLKESGEKQRKKTVDLKLSNSYLFKEIISKIENPDNFLKIICHFFENSHGVYHNHFMIDFNLINEKFKFFNEKDNEFVKRFLEKINVLDKYYLSENQLIQIVKATKTEYLLINKILYSDQSGYVIYTLSRLVNKENIHYTYTFFEKQCRIYKIHEGMRNNIAENDFDLALQFEDKLKELDYLFETNVLTQKKKEQQENKIKDKIIEDVNLLFDKEKLIDRCISIYNSLDKKSDISYQVYGYNDKMIYKGNYFSNNCSMIIDGCFRKNKERVLTQELFKEYLNENKIASYIMRLFKDGKNEFITAENIEKIRKWCFDKSTKIDFNKIRKFKNNNSFNLLECYNDWYHVMYFSQKLNIKLSHEFYLKSLEFSSIKIMDVENDLFIYIQSQLEKVDFDSQIIEDINKISNTPSQLYSHILYALKNNLPNTLERIKEFVLNGNLTTYESEILKNVSEIEPNNTRFLMKCCSDIKSRLCWDAIEILTTIDNNEIKKFVLDIAYKTIKANNDNYISYAHSILFKYNTKDALQMFYKYLRLQGTDNVRIKPKDYSNFNNIDGLEIFSEFYYYSYFECEDRFFDGKQFLDIYISNLSQQKKSYFKLKSILIKIKKQCQKEKLEVLYINNSLNYSEQVYIDSFVKKYTFDNAIKEVN